MADAEDGWMPKETAPGDTWVLVKGRDDAGLEFMEKAIRNSRDAFWPWRDWRGDSLEGRDTRGRWRRITHWRELPA